MSKQQTKSKDLVWKFDFYCGTTRVHKDKVATDKQVAYLKEKGLDVAKYTK